MATNFKELLTCCFVSLFTIYATCNKRIDCSQTDYSFNSYFKIYPDLDSIRIGDTIYIEFSHSNVFYDSVKSMNVDFKKAVNLGSVISFTEFLDNQQEIGAVNQFYRTLYTGRMNPQSAGNDQNEAYLFDEVNSEYKFRLAITPKKKGKYVITLHNAANVYTELEKCSKASFQYKFQNTNQHFYFLMQWQPNAILQEPGKSRVYYFKVY